MGRPEMDELEKKSMRLTVRFRPEEIVELENQAHMDGLTLAELIRRRALKRRVLPAVDLRLIGELRKIGGLVKMIYNETGGLYSRKTSVILDELQSTVVSIRSRINRDR
jgi:hypothetical protein